MRADMRTEPLKKRSGRGVLWIAWCALLLLFWWLLAEGRVDSLWYAVPVISAAYLGRRALPARLSLRRISFTSAFLFVPKFIGLSIVAGIDVAWRALAPHLPIRPRMVTFPLRLRSTISRVFLSQVISLMPGTLTCEVGEDTLVVHALSGTEEKIISETARLEWRVAAIFRENLENKA